MKLKTKLLLTFVCFCMCMGVITMGVFALTDFSLKAKGDIRFYPKGIQATISAGMLSSTGSFKNSADADTKMQAITITQTDTLSDLSSDLGTWTGLDLAFNDAGDDVTNNMSLQVNCGNKYDIVVANILADVIIPLSGVVKPFLKEDGYFITSGIIDMKEEAVKEALISNGFDIIDIVHMNDWVSIIAKIA